MEATLPLPADEAAQERPQGPLSQHEPSPATKQASTAGCSSSSRSECWWKRAAAHHLAAVRAVVDKLKRWIWQFIDYLLEEFDPWLKWVVFDALLSLVVAALVKRVDSLRPFFETIGWA